MKTPLSPMFFAGLLSGSGIYFYIFVLMAAVIAALLLMVVWNIINTRRKAASLGHIAKNGIIGKLTGDYDFLAYFELSTGRGSIYKISDELSAAGLTSKSQSGYDKQMLFIADRLVHPEDRADYIEKTAIKAVKKVLKDEPEYKIDHAALKDGQKKYYRTRIIKADDGKNGRLPVIVGVCSIDDEKQHELSYKSELEKEVNDRTAELRKKNGSLNRINEEIIELIGELVESRDANSGNHVARVKNYTRILAGQVMLKYPEYGLKPADVELIASASVLHDVGKIMIPDAILLKPDRLTKEEFEIMKTHCIKGCTLLQKVPRDWSIEYLHTSMDICRWHHEKYDGKGYPDGLVGDEIPISAQITSVADCYDALTTERPYKSAIAPEKAFDMIRFGECGAFSPKLMDALDSCRDKFFAGVFEIDSSSQDEAIAAKTGLEDLEILFVDDDDLSVEITTDILEEVGAHVTVARSGEEAIKLLGIERPGRFGCILIDLFMDGLSGIQTVAYIRSFEKPWLKSVPIIALSASNSPEDINSCIEAGMNGFLTKPLVVSSLSQILLTRVRDQADVLRKSLVTAEMKASRDPLTGARSIIAYTDMVEILTKNLDSDKKVAFGYLKCRVPDVHTVNDTYGSEIADMYIKNSATLISETFMRSSVFRIGGDEFAVILTGRDYEDRAQLTELFDKKIAEAESISGITSGRASVIYGFGLYDPAYDDTVSEVVKKADNDLETKLITF